MIPLITPLLLLALFPLSSSSSSPPAVSISLTPKTLAKSGDAVRIDWTGVQSPSDLDWLGIYSPPNSANKNFIGYVFLSSCNNWESGSGSIELPLVNLRSNYEFRVFRWSENEVDRSHVDHDHNPLPGVKHLLAKSEELGFESGRGPEQIHLAFTERNDEMRVMFVTADGKENFVRYGEKEDGMDEMVKTEVGRYEREDMCDAPANRSIGWRDPGFIHDGVMKNLKKGKRYYYKVGNVVGGWSTTYNYISRNENLNETIAFLFGDMGTAVPYSTFLRAQDESKSTMKWIFRDIEALGDKPAFISHVGDISYARGYSWLWDTFFNQIEYVASKVPYHVCIGNHEYDWPLQPWKPDWAQTVYRRDGGGECGVPYSIRFNMPGNSSVPTGTHAPATRNLYYSFDAGVVHFLFMSTETNFLPGSNQYNFIKSDLEIVDRKKTPFVVVQGHRPMYTTSNGLRDAPLRKKMLEYLEPLFVKNKVTLALWGHVHRYERYCPMKNFTCGDTGLNGEGLPVNVVMGMAGQDWQPIWEPRPNHLKDPVFPQPDQSLYRTGEFGYTRLHATKEKLTLTYVGNHDGEPHDIVEILSSHQVHDSEGSSYSYSKSLLPRLSQRVNILVFGALLGYAIAYISHAKRKDTSKMSWTLLKKEEVGGDMGGWSATQSFVSRNWGLDETTAFLFGDMGTSAPYKTFLRMQDESKSTMKWILRDINALIEPVASKVPYHVCIGNHEYNWPLQPWRPEWAQASYGTDGGGECGVPYSLKFNMPGNSAVPTGTHAPATRNLYYSFDVGVVHFVYISTETNFLTGSEQYNFIKLDLESVDREKTPFVIVQGHRPMYTTSNELRDEPLRVRMVNHLEPLLVKNKVTLAFWGHVHRYERFCPMKNYTCATTGVNGEDEDLPVHVVIGMAGQDWQPIWEPRPDHQNDPIFPQPERSLYRGGEFGYTRLVATKKKLTLTYIGNHDGEPHDMVEIWASGEHFHGNDGASHGGSGEEKYKLNSFVKSGSFWLLGAFLGYVAGYIYHAKKVTVSTSTWTPMKNEEI
ncbi:hypothetical protein GIB67_000770 [Kingdonia uniflora]|uniref:Purple acid phosphatase n=1 Tax=Kingdonia uniflora TaxID=39325 RepID=A0A7J7NDE3_9MAGN|nr:hypothetical protein GIB67_000770 [Kingdonia uniflora]